MDAAPQTMAREWKARVAPQVFLYAGSFLVVWVLGMIFASEFQQAAIHAAQVLGGRPLPLLSGIFYKNPNLAIYLTLLPWLAVIAMPLLSREGFRKYWDLQGFCFRYLAFLTAEVFLITIFLITIGIPFRPFYLSEAYPPAGASGEPLFRLIFFGTATAVFVLSLWRSRQHRHSDGDR